MVNNVFKTRSNSALAVLSYFEISIFSDLRVGLKQQKLHMCFVLNVFNVFNVGRVVIKLFIAIQMRILLSHRVDKM